MGDVPQANPEKARQVLDKLEQIHAEAMARLADLRKQQVDLYKRVSARLDKEASAKAAEALKGKDSEQSDK